MTTGRDNLTKSETVTIAAIEGGVAPPIEARAVIHAFHAMIRKRAGEELAPWIEPAQSSLITSFANGVAKDNSAIAAAIASHWSNGQTEGQTTKLKLVKRQMYGPAKIDLLEARPIGAERRAPNMRQSQFCTPINESGARHRITTDSLGSRISCQFSKNESAACG